jgi:hypothetical protein
MSRLRSIIADAVELNLRSMSALLSLSKDYVKAIDGIIRTSGKTSKGELGESAAGNAQRAPLLLAGETGQTASGAFIITNPSATDLVVAFAVQGEMPDEVRVAPNGLVLPAAGEAVIRIMVPITSSFEENRDYRGIVTAPGLASQVATFIVRRLSGSGEPGKPSTEAAAN